MKPSQAGNNMKDYKYLGEVNATDLVDTTPRWGTFSGRPVGALVGWTAILASCSWWQNHHLRILR